MLTSKRTNYTGKNVFNVRNKNMEFCTCIIAERDDEELKKMKCSDCGLKIPNT